MRLAVARWRSVPNGSVERSLALAVVGGAVLLSATFWVIVGARHWRDFTTSAFDMAFVDQIIWNSAHGRLFETSMLPYNYAGQHFALVLLLFVPAYWLGGGPPFLLAAQAVAATGAGVFVYIAGRRLGLSPLPAAGVVVAYLANPYLHRALLFDFHPETMIALPFFAGVALAAANRPRWAAAAALSMLLFKEDAVFLALTLAGVIWWRGAHRTALVAAVVALVVTIGGVGLVLPLLRDGHRNELANRYDAVSGGRDGLPALLWMATHPLPILARLGAHFDRAIAFVLAGGPLMLLAPLTLVAALPGLAVALLSSHDPQNGLQLHYAVQLVSIATLGTLLGLRAAARRLGERATLAMLLMLVVAGFAAASPIAPYRPSADKPPSAEHRRAVIEALAVVPLHGAVSAQSGLAARLSQRDQIWEFPGESEIAEWVVVDRYGQVSRESVAAGYDAALREVGRRYERVFARNGVEVFRRLGASP